ncbi:hypothetical protein VNO77_03428 [Canavalia gladiata]|uniref:Uncharacterized protein n=1 Tax=Canavalia gladiata TaxID=3824 RepID=A0AAN9MZU9_CANGL
MLFGSLVKCYVYRACIILGEANTLHDVFVTMVHIIMLVCISHYFSIHAVLLEVVNPSNFTQVYRFSSNR